MLCPVKVNVALEPGRVLKRAVPPRYPPDAACRQVPEYAMLRSGSSTDRSRKAAVTDEEPAPGEPDVLSR